MVDVIPSLGLRRRYLHGLTHLMSCMEPRIQEVYYVTQRLAARISMNSVVKRPSAKKGAVDAGSSDGPCVQ